MTLITLVTLPALDVLANCAALPAELLPPPPVQASQTQPMSGSIETVDTASSQKKKLRKYSSFAREARKHSIAKHPKNVAVRPKKY